MESRPDVKVPQLTKKMTVAANELKMQCLLGDILSQAKKNNSTREKKQHFSEQYNSPQCTATGTTFC